ncbi:MAG: response regulator transcription factor [Pseudomonadota bacterium]
MQRKPYILVVDDDAHIRDVLRFALTHAGFDVAEAGDGAAALERALTDNFDLIVLDIMLPEQDGIEVCTTLRRSSNVPILFLTSRDDEVDRVIGLELGADDYVTKPFSPRELIARIRAILRRPRMSGEQGPIETGGLTIDRQRRSASWSGTTLELTNTEFELLALLAGRPGKVFARDELMQGAYPGKRVVSHRTIDSHIRRLRDKLKQAGADAIHTAHGIGYRLET